jgi:hypothetical protein
LVFRVRVGNYWGHLLRPNVTEQLEQHLELKTILSDMDTPLKRIDRTVEQIQDTLEGNATPLLIVMTLTFVRTAFKRTKILQWLSAEPYQKHHKQAHSGFLSGPGAWLLADLVYKKWKVESASSILWLHGIPGSGKSKLVYVMVGYFEAETLTISGPLLLRTP